MKVDVVCRACEVALLLDEAFIGTALPCPSCGSVDGLKVEAAPSPAAVPPLPVSPAPAAIDRPAQAAKPAATPTTPVAPAAPAVAAPQPTEVVCPRCKLHFTPRSSHTATARSERPTVLVVEDMAYFQEIARDALTPQFEVRAATDLDEARQLLSAGGIDLMVLDLTLDGGDHGIQLLREISGMTLPILIYTAQDESEMYGDSWDELQRLGADDIVMKGMNVGESLARKVGALLGIELDEDD